MRCRLHCEPAERLERTRFRQISRSEVAIQSFPQRVSGKLARLVTGSLSAVSEAPLHSLSTPRSLLGGASDTALRLLGSQRDFICPITRLVARHSLSLPVNRPRSAIGLSRSRRLGYFIAVHPTTQRAFETRSVLKKKAGKPIVHPEHPSRRRFHSWRKAGFQFTNLLFGGSEIARMKEISA
jgi:hypothetical protein